VNRFNDEMLYDMYLYALSREEKRDRTSCPTAINLAYAKLESLGVKE
jgi:hypothetical protein